MKLNQILNEDENLLLELGDAPYPWEWTREPTATTKSGEASFDVDNDTFSVQLYYREEDDRTKIFWDKNMKFDGVSGDNPVRIIFTIMDIIKTYMTGVRPKYITFDASKGYNSSRGDRNKLGSLYTRLIKRFAVKAGYSSEIDHDRGKSTFLLTRRDKKRRMG